MSANSSAPLVKVRDLRKSFGQNQVLRGVDLDVARDVVSVIGLAAARPPCRA
jgi:polar amino acid transport system ATP-binding protein